MKKIYILLLSFFLLSCEDDFLDRLPLDQISPENFFNSAQDLKIYANNLYGVLPSHNGTTSTFTGDNNSDNLVPDNFDARLGGTLVVPTGASGTGWNWGSVRETNYFLSQLGKFPLDDEAKSYVAEVRFFRAYLHFGILQQYGDIPWLDKPLNEASPELFGKRLPRNQVVDKILDDLDYAIENLRWRDGAERGRLNKETAYAFKSRVALYEGTWEKYHANTAFGVAGSNGEKYLKLAVEASQKLMESGKSSIYNTGKPLKDYHELFNQVNYQPHTEAILWREYKAGESAHRVQTMLPLQGQGTGFSRRLVDSYLCTDGLPIGVAPNQNPLYSGDGKLKEFVKNRDPRLKQSVLTLGDVTEANADPSLSQTFESLSAKLVTSGFNGTSTGFMIFKGASENAAYNAQKDSEIGAIIFRYAEVLLNYAEAKAELGELTQNDIDISIKLLRDRVGMPNMELGKVNAFDYKDHLFPKVSKVINEIRRERTVELALESHRLNDLMRWAAHEIILNYQPQGFKYVGSDVDDLAVTNREFDDAGYVVPYKKTRPNGYQFNPERDYLLPIPIGELTLNKDLKQNPGWN